MSFLYQKLWVLVTQLLKLYDFFLNCHYVWAVFTKATKKLS